MSLTITDLAGYHVLSSGVIVGKRGRPLQPETIKGGYQRVVINGRHRLVHVLVAHVHLGPRPEGLEVNHRDGDKTNNAATNLEYVTPAENVRHSISVLGVVRAPGERNGNARLTAATVAEMRAAHAEGATAAAIGRRFGVDVGHAWRIVTHRSWRHVA